MSLNGRHAHAHRNLCWCLACRYYDTLFDTPVYKPYGHHQVRRVKSVKEEIKTLDVSSTPTLHQIDEAGMAVYSCSTYWCQALFRSQHSQRPLQVYVGSSDQSLGMHTSESYTLHVGTPHSSIEVGSTTLCSFQHNLACSMLGTAMLRLLRTSQMKQRNWHTAGHPLVSQILTQQESCMQASSVFGAMHGLESFSQMVERIDLGPALALGAEEGAEQPGQARRLQQSTGAHEGPPASLHSTMIKGDTTCASPVLVLARWWRGVIWGLR